MMYFVPDKPVPVLNTPYFKEVYGTAFSFDDEHLVRALEYIALPNQVFTITGENENNILQVITPKYPSEASLYVDSRFGKIHAAKMDLPKVAMPSKELILERLLSKVGRPYVWV